MELHLPDNIKIHYAGCEVATVFIAVKELGVRYGLYSAFPFVERMVFGKGKSPIIPLKTMTNPYRDIPAYISGNMLHVIQDSGLFTLMYGARAGNYDKNLITRWYDALCQFTSENAPGVTCVEVDCQNVLDTKTAWEFRCRMRNDLAGHRIINVFHLCDGKDGLDRMIEFSDYIAISIPELRISGNTKSVYALAKYIKSKKPSIDIHLLGCMDLGILKHMKFCTSCDATAYISWRKYGIFCKHHKSTILGEKVMKLIGKEKYDYIRMCNNEINTNATCLQIEYYKSKLESVCGNQDYYKKLT